MTEEKEEKLPVLRGYPFMLPHEAARISVYCPWCDTWHIHSLTEDLQNGHSSPRKAHCRSKASPFHEKGYRIAMIQKVDLTRIAEWLKVLAVAKRLMKE